MAALKVFALCMVAMATASPIVTMNFGYDPVSVSFEDWAVFHSKNYSCDQEKAIRKEVFNTNMKYINEFNAEGHSYTLGMNEFGDMLHSEFSATMLGTKVDLSKPKRGADTHKSVGDVPDSVDWRTSGYVTPVKNQGQCGSCWSFSTTGSVEGQHFKATGKLVSLSEQNLMDCSTSEGNQGCNGGLMDDAFQYIIKNGGVDTESSYPYTARDGTCHYSAANLGATISKFTDVAKENEDDLKNAVGSVGPVSVAIDASHSSFQFYKSGVYDPLFCSETALDHGVLAVGYGSEDSKDYWLVKNSWGASWGQSGYINMVRNAKNKCGIATSASYPTV